MSLAALAAAVRPAVARMISMEARCLPMFSGLRLPYSSMAQLNTAEASTRGLAASVLTPSTSGPCAMQVRGMAHKPTPRFTGGKMKPSSAFKERFRMTGSGEIKYQRAGHVHKRFNKSNRQRRELGKAKIMDPTFAKIVKKLGFKSRFY